MRRLLETCERLAREVLDRFPEDPPRLGRTLLVASGYGDDTELRVEWSNGLRQRVSLDIWDARRLRHPPEMDQFRERLLSCYVELMQAHVDALRRRRARENGETPAPDAIVRTLGVRFDRDLVAILGDAYLGSVGTGPAAEATGGLTIDAILEQVRAAEAYMRPSRNMTASELRAREAEYFRSVQERLARGEDSVEFRYLGGYRWAERDWRRERDARDEAERRNHYRARAEAEHRGLALLREWLTPEQRAQYDAHRWFEVRGSHSGKTYRIRHGEVQNVFALDGEGREAQGWCFGPAGGLVAGDVMLAQKLALETDEKDALAVANQFFTAEMVTMFTERPERSDRSWRFMGIPVHFSARVRAAFARPAPAWANAVGASCEQHFGNSRGG
ncbi:MAG: hypothetical protein HXY30_14895 [Pseudorhodoplanes sp.]|nr:hypothetical protein [Pseudorhodoplanes sp.]